MAKENARSDTVVAIKDIKGNAAALWGSINAMVKKPAGTDVFISLDN